MQVVNVYDNHLQENHPWSEVDSKIRRTVLVDTNCDSLIKGKVVLLEDFNAHSLY